MIRSLLKEYYKQTKPHLNDDEIGFLMEDNFNMTKKLMRKEILKEKN